MSSTTMSKGLLSWEIPLVSSRQQQKGKGEHNQENHLGCLSSSTNLSISLRKGIHLHQQFPFVSIPVCSHPPFTLPTFSPGFQLGNLLWMPSPDVPAQTPGTFASWNSGNDGHNPDSFSPSFGPARDSKALCPRPGRAAGAAPWTEIGTPKISNSRDP